MYFRSATLCTPLLLLLIIYCATSGGLQRRLKRQSYGCINDHGEIVDWALAYQVAVADTSYLQLSGARIKGQPRSRRTPNDGWIMTGIDIRHPDSMVRRTLDPVYNNQSKVDFMFYNDQPPQGAAAVRTKTRAHAKGVLVMDIKNDIGFWLRHSLPRFPVPIENSVDDMFERNLGSYSQLFMCITLKPSVALKTIADHLITMRVHSFQNRFSKAALKLAPVLKDAVTLRKRFEKTTDQTLHSSFRSYSGQNITLFSKTKDFQFDIYVEAAKAMHNDMLVTAWRQGSGNFMPSQCDLSSSKVNNVESFEYFDNATGTKYEWPITKEHSKWAITHTANNGALFCVGDLNRVDTQFMRGGGLMCIDNKQIHDAFSSLVRTYCGCGPESAHVICDEEKWAAPK
ncbi:Deoxyribonuclease-2-alpha, partial [Fragariocoptes setiger]